MATTLEAIEIIRLKAINADLLDQNEVLRYRIDELLAEVPFDNGLPLSRAQSAIVALLLRTPGKVIPHQALLTAADTDSIESLRVQITKIRQAAPSVEISNVLGRGYRATMRGAG
jgi:DNA-binding response OmpR family regulator